VYTPRQVWQHATPKAQLLMALSLATVLAFSVGLAAGIYGGATYLSALTTDRNAAPAVAQPPRAASEPQQQPAVAAPVARSGSAYDASAYVEYLTARPAASSPNVPVIGTGSVYDGGHYRAVETYRLDPAQQSVLNYLQSHSSASGVARVPYEAGWELYDNGWAGGPRTAPAQDSSIVAARPVESGSARFEAAKDRRAELRELRDPSATYDDR
jgi:hypothetical protein